jgi:outer membrane protein assembly factor BamB
VIGYGGFRGKKCDGGVAAFRGSDGASAWTFSIRSFAKRKRFFAYRHAVFSAPALSDTDGDGLLEVGFGAFDRTIYLLSAKGQVRWYTQAADTVFSSAAFFDVDGDGLKEMLIGTDISKNTIIRPPTPDGGYLYALRTKPDAPRSQRFFRFRDPRLALWRVQFDQVIQSSPVVAELVSSNPGPELVIGTGCFFPQSSATRRGRWFKVLSARTGKTLKTLPIPECSPSSAAIADLDGDSINEVVVSTNGPRTGGASHLIAWRPESNTVLWDRTLSISGRGDQYGAEFNRSPIIADLDGNGSLEALVAHRSGIAVVAGTTGEPLSCMLSDCTQVRLRIPSLAQGTPAFADADGDGTPELYLGGASNRRAAVFQWRDQLLDLASQPGPFTPFLAPWPMGRGDAQRGGS